jgi:hypothetical protein
MSVVFLPFLLFLLFGVVRFFAASLRARHPVAPGRASRQRRLRRAGVAILVTGLLVAAYIDMQVVLDEQAQAAAPGVDRRQFQHTFAPADTKKSELAVESIAGKEGVLGTEITEWFESLAHGRRLACTVAVLSIAGFLACLLLAHPRLGQPHPSEGADAPRDA